jgi:D-glycero-D-manno-heptose 1,7-bisphosphate phosphatase
MKNNLKKAIFLDRDGVINSEKNYVHRIEDFSFIPGAIPALKLLQDMDFCLVIITNQAGIARGYYTESDFLKLMDFVSLQLEDHGINILATYHCPHHPLGEIPELSINCLCRKPQPGMLLKAISDFQIDISQSVVIGDKCSDIEAGRAAGIGKAIIVRSGHPLTAKSEQVADHCCNDLLNAAQLIKLLEENKG